MTTAQDIEKELRTALANGEDLEDIKDRSGEWIDGYVPVYHNRILDEWQEIPSEYDNRGYAELGGQEYDIIRQMMADLYVYYSDLFFEAVSEIESEIEEKEETVNA